MRGVDVGGMIPIWFLCTVPLAPRTISDNAIELPLYINSREYRNFETSPAALLGRQLCCSVPIAFGAWTEPCSKIDHRFGFWAFSRVQPSGHQVLLCNVTSPHACTFRPLPRISHTNKVHYRHLCLRLPMPFMQASSSECEPDI